MDFADATAITPLGDGEYLVNLQPEYSIGGGKPNGGYLLACLGRAAVEAARASGATQRHPISAGVQYLFSPDLGKATIKTEISRVGRSASQVSAKLIQDDKVFVEARFTLANLNVDTQPFWGATKPVEIAPIEDCVSFAGNNERPPSNTRVIFDPQYAFSFDDTPIPPERQGEVRAWFEVDDDLAVDPIMLLYACDSLPPATFSIVRTGWVPTLDLTAYIRAIPVPGPLRIRFRAQLIQDGFVDEVYEIWDQSNQLVAQATQIAAIRLPEQ